MTMNRDDALQRSQVRSAQSAVMRVFLSVAESIAYGQLKIELPSGEVLRIEAPNPGPESDLVIHDERAVRRLFSGGKLAFAESYIDGEWSSDSLAALIELGARNEHILAPTWSVRTAVVAWHALLNRARHLIGNRNSRRGAKRNIASHYDLGNDFYRQWLDPTMTYSSALFESADQSLQEAQIAKWRRIAEMADLQPGQRVLEIGCGWGGFARWAARERGCQIVGLTLSNEQRDWALAAIAKDGLQDQIEIRLQDYRDVEGSFDRIVSIEMFEAVGEAYWPAFYDTLRARLVHRRAAGHHHRRWRLRRIPRLGRLHSTLYLPRRHAAVAENSWHARRAGGPARSRPCRLRRGLCAHLADLARAFRRNLERHRAAWLRRALPPHVALLPGLLRRRLPRRHDRRAPARAAEDLVPQKFFRHSEEQRVRQQA